MNRPATAGFSYRQQSGFTLVEVLVTIFVVAIGLLTAAGLQAVSKKAAFEAMQRTTATVLAQDMLERLRSNPTQVIVKGVTVAGGYIGRDVRSTPTAVSCGASVDCTPAQLVLYDYARWWEALDGATEKIANGTDPTTNAGGLRSPVGCVRRAGDWVEVIIEWRGLTAVDQVPDSSNPDDPTSATCGFVIADYERVGNVSFRRVLRLQAHIKTPS